MGERTRIARYFAPLAVAEAGSFTLSDDAAVLIPPPGQQLVVTTDSVIEGIHILPDAMPNQYAQKLLRRNLSDLAAMGATPWRYTLNLHTPAGLEDAWFAAFAVTLAGEQQQFGLVLVGGDSTTGGKAIHATITCFGLLNGAALRRDGAGAADDLYVSGSLGGAAYALSLLQQKMPVSDLLGATYYCPEPRLQLGHMLRGIATSAIDVSDGLLADVAQLCTASQCGARLEHALLPLHAELPKNHTACEFALSGGDDYELCFTAPPAKRDAIAALAQTLDLPLTRIGSIITGDGVIVVDAGGEPMPITRTGYEHA